MDKKQIYLTLGLTLIGSVLFSFLLEPILRYLLTSATLMSFSAYREFVDDLYRNAAFGMRSAVPVFFLVTLIPTLWGFFTGFLFIGAIISFLPEKKQTTVEEKIDTLFLPKISQNVVTLIIFALLLLLTYFTIVQFSGLQMNTSFNQRLNVLAPHLSEQQEEELKAMWALMKSRQDYENINAEFENYAQQFNLELPELQWK